MRGLLLTVHRWLGLTCGVVFAIAALTGAVLVYADDLDTLLAGPRFLVTPGSVDATVIESMIRRERPEWQIVRVIWPDGGANVLNVRIRNGAEQEDVMLDAGSGRLLSPRPPHFMLRTVRRLHTTLMLGSVSGHIVLVASIASIPSLILGLTLWWPGPRHLAQGFRFRLLSRMNVLIVDAHHTFGAAALPLLFAMTVSAMLLEPRAFNVLSRLLRGNETERSWAVLRSSEHACGTGAVIDLPTALRAALAETRGGRPLLATFPVATDGIVEVRVRGGSTSRGDRTVRVALDCYSGAVLASQQLVYSLETNVRVHFGLIGGPIVRALYAASCLAGFILLPTGVAMWWNKARRKVQGRGVSLTQ